MTDIKGMTAWTDPGRDSQGFWRSCREGTKPQMCSRSRNDLVQYLLMWRLLVKQIDLYMYIGLLKGCTFWTQRQFFFKLI